MIFQVSNGSFPAAISNNHIHRIAHPGIPSEMGAWEKIEDFFCETNKPEALECIQRIYHPPGRTIWEDVVSRFERLRALAYAGRRGNIQFGRHGEGHFCILDSGSREILSVIPDNAGKYTVNCQGHNETHNLSLRTELRAEDYEAVWSTWEIIAPPEESYHRAIVVQKMRDCLNNGNPELNLSNFDITSLPDRLPPDMARLILDNVPLTNLPALPSGLQTLRASHSELVSLPMLPSGLQELVINHNVLISLPELPSELQKLVVDCNTLSRLPALPSGLQTLSGSHNYLSTLPALPPALQELKVDDNEITSLPELPSGLQTLWASYNELNYLPVLPSGLQALTVNNNRLTRLPESIAGLSGDMWVDLSGNPLSDRTRQALLDMTHAPNYSGPRIYFGVGGPPVFRKPRPLHQAVADWLVPAREGEPRLAGKWQAFEQQDDAASFSSFLDRLSETENFKKDSGFKTQIASWLAQLVDDDELRAKTFAMATEATSSCEDRVTLALNKMKNVQLVHNAEKGEFNENLPGLVSVGREMFRLEKLEQIAREKVKTLYFVDEIEVYLGYQNKLKQPLELTSVTAEMRFFGVSGVTESDLQSAEIQVKTAENSQFAEWILQWEPLRKVLERTEPTSWEALCEKKISDYENTYRILSDTELKPAGLLGNNDAERIIGARAMESAERAFLDGLHPLAGNMLGRYLKPRWS